MNLKESSFFKARLDRLIQSQYRDVKRRARIIVRRVHDPLLTPTVLVNELYRKLVSAREYQDISTTHFPNLADKSMKHIVEDERRRRRAEKRGGEEASFVPLEQDFPERFSLETFLITEDLIGRLSEVSKRQATVIVDRFRNGFTIREIATKLGISESTVERDIDFARAWVHSEWLPKR